MDELENMMLNERSQKLKATYYMTSFMGNVQNGQICRDSRAVTARNWRARGMGVTA